MSSDRKLDDRLILCFLASFTLLFRLLTVQMINVGPDEIDYWYSAKILFSKIPYGELNHRNIRWAIILPTFLIQRVLGIHPIVYIVGPVLLSCLQTCLVYDLGKRLLNRGTGVLAALMLTVFPYMIRTGSQIRPGVFSLSYLLAAFWVIVRSPEALTTERRWRATVIACAILVLCSYETKITNLYFLPFFAVTIYAVCGKRLKPLIAFLALLAAGYVVEHLLYTVLTGSPLGRLSIVTRTHLQSAYTEKFEHYTFLGLFDRFNDTNFPLFWKLVFLLYLLSTGFLAFRWRRGTRRSWNWLVLLLVLSFTFLLTFAVKSIRPVVPVEPYQNRYFTPLLPWMFLIIAAGVMELSSLAGRSLVALTERWTSVALLLGVVLVVLVAAFYFGLYPASFAEYAPALANPREHVLPLYFRFARLADQAWERDLPALSVSPQQEISGKAIDTLNRVFLRWRERRPAAPIRRVASDGLVYLFVARANVDYDRDYLSGIEGRQVLVVDRFPFRVWMSTTEEERRRLESVGTARTSREGDAE